MLAPIIVVSALRALQSSGLQVNARPSTAAVAPHHRDRHRTDRADGPDPEAKEPLVIM